MIYVQRRVVNTLMRKSDLIQIKRIKRDRGRHIIIVVEVVKKS